MATRSQLQFIETWAGDKPFVVAMIYDHWDGYPSYRLKNIQDAILLANKDYEEEPGFSYRLKTPHMTDLAAFYILSRKKGAGGTEIDNGYHGDIEYLYQISNKEGRIYVKILTPTRRYWDEPLPYDAPHDLKMLDKFFEVYDEGFLEDLVEKHCEGD